jgi:hypothetical protein
MKMGLRLLLQTKLLVTYSTKVGASQIILRFLAGSHFSCRYATMADEVYSLSLLLFDIVKELCTFELDLFILRFILTDLHLF